MKTNKINLITYALENDKPIKLIEGNNQNLMTLSFEIDDTFDTIEYFIMPRLILENGHSYLLGKQMYSTTSKKDLINKTLQMIDDLLSVGYVE